MTDSERDAIFDVVWSGTLSREGLCLTEHRATKSLEVGPKAKRIYNKKSDYWGRPRAPKIVNVIDDEEQKND